MKKLALYLFLMLIPVLADAQGLPVIRNYTAEEMKNIIIPFQYESFRKAHNKLVPKKLEEEEIEILYKMCNGRTRQVVPSIYKYLSAMFDTQGRKHQLSSEEIKKLVRNISDDEKQMGFSI